jgi:hypothetical protein
LGACNILRKRVTTLYFRKFWLLAILVLFKLNSIVPAYSPQTERSRDSGRYETAGPYVLDLTLNGRDRDTLNAAIRQFIWEHYRSHRLAHVKVTQYSKEGEPSISSYFVEDEKDGAWHVRVEIYRKLIDRRNTSQIHETNDRFDAFALQRVRVAGPAGVQVPLADSEPIPSTGYRLKLLGKDQELLTEI